MACSERMPTVLSMCAFKAKHVDYALQLILCFGWASFGTALSELCLGPICGFQSMHGVQAEAGMVVYIQHSTPAV